MKNSVAEAVALYYAFVCRVALLLVFFVPLIIPLLDQHAHGQLVSGGDRKGHPLFAPLVKKILPVTKDLRTTEPKRQFPEVSANVSNAEKADDFQLRDSSTNANRLAQQRRAQGAQTGTSPLALAVVSATLPPRTRITSLAVHLVTSDELFAGINDFPNDTHMVAGTGDVWLDIGPKAWNLGSDFSRGADRTIPIDLKNEVPLYVEDIIELRLEKKGIHGWTNAPDSLLDTTLPFGATPKDLVASFRRKVDAAKYAIDESQSIVDAQKKIIDTQTAVINKANSVVDSTSHELSRLSSLVRDLENKLADLQRQLAQTPQKISREIRKAGPLRFLLFGPAATVITEKIMEPNGVWEKLTNNVNDLMKRKNDVQAQVARFTLDKERAVRDKATAEGTKAIGEAAKTAAQLQVTAAQKALGAAQKGLAEIEALAEKFPFPSLDLPKPGEWKPESVTLIVNGEEFANFPIAVRLKKGHPAWVRLLKPLLPEERFVFGLRVNVNSSGGHVAEEVSRFTTLFKKLGISGWELAPIPSSTVTGVLKNPPSPGADGFVSLDLQLELVRANGREFVLDDKHGVRHTRFIRVEYKHQDELGEDDTRYKEWKVGDRFEVGGVVKWDTDQYGFYEVHPRGRFEVKALGR